MKKTSKRIGLGLLIVLLLVLMTSSVSAEAKQIDYPPKTIEIVVPAAAGGDIDFMARTFSEKLSERWGNNIIVTNVGSSNAAASTYALRDGKADGSQVILYQSNITIQTINGTYNFDLDGLKYSICVGQLPGYVICVPAASGIKTLDELKDAALANPGGLKFGMTPGGSTEITAKMLEEGMGVKFNMVDSGTSSEKVTNLLGGHLDLTTIPYGNAKPYIESGDFVALASLGNDPNPNTPDIKACGELGINTEFSIRYTFIFSPKTDDAIIDFWNTELADIITNDSDYAERLANQYFEVPYTCSVEELMGYYGELQELAKKYLY